MMALLESFFRLLAWRVIAGMGLVSLAPDAKAVGFPHRLPGECQFAVMSNARTAADVLASSRFSVDAVSWETRWFQGAVIVVCAGALIAFVFTIVLRRVRARLKELEEETVLAGERVRIARDMHENLAASLMQITVATELARISAPTETPPRIQKVANLARHTVEALEEIAWMVNPRNDTLDSTLEYFGQYAIDFLAAADIACELDIPFELPRRSFAIGARHHLLMAIKEALHNVVKHAAAKTVHFEVQCGERALLVTIADDGQGFAIGNVPAGAAGLRSIRSRIAELGGTFRIESRPSAGTCVTFEMRLAGTGS